MHLTFEEVTMLDKVWMVWAKSAKAGEHTALFASKFRAKWYAEVLHQEYREDHDDDDIVVLVFEKDIDLSC
jgi:hypothetical protein